MHGEAAAYVPPVIPAHSPNQCDCMHGQCTQNNGLHPTPRDQRVYVQPLRPQGAPATPLTAEGSGQRFADYRLDADRGRLLAVCEDHSDASKEAVNFLAAIGGNFWTARTTAAKRQPLPPGRARRM
jgi:hypothetical protein